MLLSLKVRNYALIDELYVDFHKGLNIITGETGAGKSILLGALGLILGKRADLSVLSNKDSKCVVEAEFDIRNYKLMSVFENYDVDYDDITVIRREILSSGKSRAFINDTPVNLNVITEIALQFVDIHSQHQNLLLNKQAYILGLIDRYCRNEKLIREYTELFIEFKEAERKYTDKLHQFTSINKEYDFHLHQFNELKEARLKSGELEDMEKEMAELDNSGEIKSILHEIESVLTGEESGVIDQLSLVIQRLNRIENVFLKSQGFLTQVNGIAIELKDLQSEISSTFEQLEFDPQRYEEVKERLDLLNGLLLKYKKNGIDELIVFLEEVQRKVSISVDGGFELEKQKENLDKQRNILLSKATELSETRKSAFSGFEDDVSGILTEMGMEHAVISLSHTDQELSMAGIDSVGFNFTANKNHPLQDVAKIASGGELSRLMLAIKAVLSTSWGMPTLVLDEIDTGVSGVIADKVGNIINQISKGIQVINITHLPQVASKGQSHFLVYKDHEKDITRTLIKKLEGEERLFEIAKMLSGEELTEAAIENARVLLGE